MPLGAILTLVGLVLAFVVHAVIVGYGRGRQDEKIDQQAKQRIEDKMDAERRRTEDKHDYERRLTELRTHVEVRISEARGEARERDSTIGETGARERQHVDEKLDNLAESIGKNFEQVKDAISALSARVGNVTERTAALEAQAKKSDPHFKAVGRGSGRHPQLPESDAPPMDPRRERDR